MTKIIVGDIVTVPYKSMNQWNEGHKLSGKVLSRL